MISLPQVFSQRDGRWANKKLGTGSTTIGGFGCLLSCMAMLCKYYGKDTDPDRLNESLKAVDGFTSGNLYEWYTGVPVIYTDIKCTKIKDTPFNLTKVHWDEIDAELNAGRPVVAEVDFIPETSKEDMHFVLILSGSQGEYQVADPWYGDISNLRRYGEPKVTIQRYVFHSGPVPQTTSELDQVKAQLEELKKAHEVVLKERNDFEGKYKRAANDAEEANRQLEGAKRAIGEWEEFLDKIWILLNPIGKTKTQQSVLAEITEMINKEDADRDTAEKYEELQKTTKAFRDSLREKLKSNAQTEADLLSALDLALKGVKPDPTPPVVVPPETPQPPDYNKMKKALESIVKFILRLVGR